MSEPIVIQGFPVPPGCSMFREHQEGWAFCFGNPGRNTFVYLDNVPNFMVFIIQSVGYRAWMDEAARIGMDLKELYDGTGRDFYVRQNTLIAAQKLALVNAEACRTWMPKGEI